MQNISLSGLKENITFTDDLMLDNNFLLLPPSCPVTKELMIALKEWQFDMFTCEGNISFVEYSSEENEQPDEKENVEEDKTKNEKIGQSVKKVLENSLNSQLDGSDKSRMMMVQSVYNEYTNYIENVFTHYATHKTIDKEELSETVKDLCVFIKDNRRYILRINPHTEQTNKNFLITHTMRATVLALAIAMQMHMPFSKMIELGVASILHEIGMLRLPPQIYMTEKKLTPGEKIQIYKHPLYSYSIIKDLDFPLTIQLGVLEHHEKENGTGYPRKMTGDKISSLAKIISIACSYEAITSPRSFRDEKSNFDAILELLQNNNHPYDESIIKALLFTVSLYPIGSYVYLTNRKIAIVIDTNPDDPRQPVVQMLTEFDKEGNPLVIQTATSEIKILRILSKHEQEDILRLISEQEDKPEEEVKEKEEQPEEIQELDELTILPEASPEDEFEPVKPTEIIIENEETPVAENNAPLNNRDEKKTDNTVKSTSSNNNKNNDKDMEEVDITFFN